jgi:anaerobic C4-dicarboxylate transporter
MIWLELPIVMLCIFIGARVGGIALGTVAWLSWYLSLDFHRDYLRAPFSG